MSVKHATTTAAADDPAYDVSADEWNADHTILDFALPSDISPAQLTANTNDWNPNGLATSTVIRFSTDASRDLTGIVGGADGRILLLINTGLFPLVLKHDITSTAANRFYLPGSVDDVIMPGVSYLVWYDSTSSRWRTVSIGVNPITKSLTADQSDITGTGLVELAGLTVPNVGVGTYRFSYAVIWQATATSTGVELVVDHTGTVTEFVSTAWTQTTGATGATGVADQVTTATAQLIEGKSARVAGARTGVLQGTDTLNANQLTVIEGVAVVTVVGSLQVFMAAEAAALVVRAKRGSSLILHKTA